MKKTLAVIGFGRFGQLLVSTLLEHTNSEVLVVSSQKSLPKSPRLHQVSLPEVARADIVLPCVPISSFRHTIEQVAPLLKKNALVIDVCSVKVMPAEIMRELLPAHVQIIASHPLFGPDSVTKNHGLKQLPLVLWNERCEAQLFAEIKHWCEHLGLHVLVMSPQEHDRHAAHSQALAFLVGTLLKRMRISATPIDTLGFNLLLELKENFTGKDSEQLFWDLETANPFAAEMWQTFARETEVLINDLNKRTASPVKSAVQ